MVRIVVNGVGKLGRAIVSAAQYSAGQNASDKEASVTVVAGVDRHLVDTQGPDALSVPLYASLDEVTEPFDVLVDASTAGALDEVVAYAVQNNKPLLIAATGHDDAQVEQIAVAAQQIPILRSSNLSVGVNVVRKLVADAARILGPVDTEIVEAHHRMKVDAPSGTALTLAQAVRDASDPERPFVYGRTPDTAGARGNEIGIHAVRGGTVVGEHTVTFLLEDEIVEVRHLAQSRQVFGFGALQAARFLAQQSAGLYSMEDLLG